MSSLQVDNIQSYNANPPVIKSSSGAEVGTFCRAWVNFNGSGTVAIRASFNVSSITDNGTGDYTVNFTTAMPDANYSITATAAPVYNGSVVNTGDNMANDNTFVATTSLCNVCVRGNGSSFATFDSLAVHVAIFR